MTKKGHRALRVLIALVVLLVGALITLLVGDSNTPIGLFSNSLGLALLVTGCVSVFHELVLPAPETADLRAGFDQLSGLLEKPGIRIIDSERRENERYHRWLLESEPQAIFFAGHSVLHRVQLDFSRLGFVSAGEALKRKISEGSKIRILFLDPTWELLPEIARWEGQNPVDLMTDLATTLGISRKLSEILQHADLPGSVEIRTCRELAQYAFHYVVCKPKESVEMLLGFYFAGHVGCKSPLFTAENREVHELFEVHFTTVFDRSKRLLSYSRETSYFDHAYYRECQAALAEHIGDSEVQKRCP